MKIDWTDIAIKLATATLATTWGVFLKRWLEKPEAPSEHSATKNSTAKSSLAERFKRFWRSPGIGVVFMVFGILSITRDYRLFPVVSKGFVVEMIFDALIVIYGGFAYFALTFSGVIKDMLHVASVHNESITIHHRAITLLAEAREMDRDSISN